SRVLRYSAPNAKGTGRRYHLEMQDRFASAIAANRFGLGARPGELASISGDPRGWLAQQLKGSPPAVTESGLRSSSDILAEAIDLRRDQRDQRRAKKAKASDEPAPNAQPNAAALQALIKLPKIYRPIYMNEVTARLRQAVATDRPFVERLTQFW